MLQDVENKAIICLNLFKQYIYKMTLTYGFLFVANVVCIITSACLQYTKDHLTWFILTFIITSINLLIYGICWGKIYGFKSIFDIVFYNEILDYEKTIVLVDFVLNFLWCFITFIATIVVGSNDINNDDEMFLIIELVLICILSGWGTYYSGKTYSKLNDNKEAVTTTYTPGRNNDNNAENPVHVV